MTLRTPRRRISPRTKRRYRAIKGFLQRALGTSSQPDIKTTSSIEVSVSDLKNKIIGIEQQLNNVSKHCRDLACLEHSFRKESVTSLVQRNDGNTKKTENCDKNVKELETKVLYKTSTSQYHKSDESNNAVNINRHDCNNMTATNNTIADNIQEFQCKQRNDEFRRRSNQQNKVGVFEQHQKPQSNYKTIGPSYSTSSFHSLIESGNNHYSKPGYSGHRHEKRHSRKEFNQPFHIKEQDRDYLKKHIRSNEKDYETRPKSKRRIRDYSDFDKAFIADIIKKQYRPVKMFGRRDSDFSQFSAPVCRDQEYTIRDEIQEGSELCSCCFDEHRRRKHRYIRNTDISDMRSICDTRLYSSKKHRRYKLSRDYVDDYNNSALYDMIPVKEKSSPKTRRKFAEDNIIPYQYCKEVPPSPKSHRPRLNLKVQHYADYEDSLVHERHQSRRNSPLRNNRAKVTNTVESDISSDSYARRTQQENLNNSKSKPHIQEDVGTMSSLQYPNFVNEQNNLSNNDTTLNTQVTDSTAEKTDKTLCEIKDILQTFLLEIKKESIHSDKSDVTSKIDNKQLTQHQESTKINSNVIPNSGHNFNNYSAGQCNMPPFLPSFPNPCCYPILPVCPMNVLQNGYIIPSPSYTCTICAKNSKEPGCADKESCYNKGKTSEEINANNETQDLIKEIYKFVSQQPKSPRQREQCGNENDTIKSKNDQSIFDKKCVTNRSIGGSIKASKHDANVGTPNMKCYSKSCEAIGSRIASDVYNTTASYSDTILEKLSLEATQSSSETDLSTDVPKERVKRSKFKKVLNSLGLFKKKKRDAIEELSESDSTVEVEVKSKPPFKQHITSYAMHGQEFFHPPPVPGRYCCRSPPPDFYGHGYEPRHSYTQPRPSDDFYNHHNHCSHNHEISPPYNPTKYPTAPPYPNYDPHYNQRPPQVPLCLKEIEVKSIGTQSERKMSILQKFTKKVQPPAQQEQPLRHVPEPTKEKPSFWKSLQEKAKQNNTDPMNFSLKTQKQLAQGDMKMRNAMLKKMFYKRNPFSPRNLIVRTLLGKDKSSYGDPPKMYRPRMFL